MTHENKKVSAMGKNGSKDEYPPNKTGGRGRNGSIETPCTPVEAKEKEKCDCEHCKFRQEYHCCGEKMKGHSIAGIWKCDYCTLSCHAPRPAEGSLKERFEEAFEHRHFPLMKIENESDLCLGIWQFIKPFIAAELAKKDEEIKQAKKEGYDSGRAWHDYGFKEALSSYRAELREKVNQIPMSSHAWEIRKIILSLLDQEK